MKRVYALYRVSTAKQVDRVVYGNSTKDEIPMQKIACHGFAESQHDLEIIREFEEKGVSGFKVSAENRDAIQDLKEALYITSLTFFSHSCSTVSAESKTKRRLCFNGSQSMELKFGLSMKVNRSLSIM